MEEKKSQKRGWIHKLIIMVLVVVAGVSGGQFLKIYIEDYRAQREDEKLVQMISQEETPSQESTEESREEMPEETAKQQEPPYISPIDFEKLAEMNPDVVAWIRIPDTNIDYPIVQSSNNDEYLYKSFEGEESKAGSIFLDFESQSNLRGYNNIIYGHNMKSGFMFKDINRFKDEEYFKEHQYFEIYTPRETIHLKAVSCYYIKNTPEVSRTDFRNKEAFDDFVQRMLEPCAYAEFPEKEISGLYTLVTCSYEVDDGRTVLFAIETDTE